MNQTTREDFTGTSLATSGETHQAALAAAAQASVNARFIMAIQRPRNWDDVRVRLLAECKRPGFAAVARYNKPIGKGVKGPSIRFAEACFRYAQNMDAPITTTFEDKFKRILHVQLIDFETNASYSADITIDKVVERRDRKDRTVLGERKNSRGDTVFVVEATEDELLNKQNALVSKALRTLILRMIPGDIVEEGQAECVRVMAEGDAKDPAAAKKKLVDAFAELGVMPKELEALVGHGLDVLQPAEMVELREAYASVRDGESTWRAILEAKYPTAEPGTTKVAGSVHDLEAQLRGHGREATPAPAATTSPAAPPPPVATTAPANDAPPPPAKERKARAAPAPQGAPRAAPQQATIGEFPGDPPPQAAATPPVQVVATPVAPPVAVQATPAPVAVSTEDEERKLVSAWNLTNAVGCAVRVKDRRSGTETATTTAAEARIFGQRAIVEVNDGQGGRIMAMLCDVMPWAGG